ncbi:MAG TPA: GPW/gp25 family protein [Xanthobacteraceae bacterium]|nr:GPW/gp25 family protein [Xanthobacteraceae bacterium]
MSTDGHDAPFLGRGWAFPPSFSEGGAQVETVAGAQDVAQALAIIFATELGERPMREDFGSALRRHMFAEIDQTLLTSLRGAIFDAILAFEPRVQIDALEIVESEETAGLLTVSLHYTLRGTNSRYNLVYPFYIREASTTVTAGGG